METAFREWVETFTQARSRWDIRGDKNGLEDYYNNNYLFQLSSSWEPATGCSVDVRAWEPGACQGRCGFPSYSMHFIPEKFRHQYDSPPAREVPSVNWTRGSVSWPLVRDNDDNDGSGDGDGSLNDSEDGPNDNEDSDDETATPSTTATPTIEHLHNPNNKEEIVRGFRCLFGVLMKSGIRLLQIGSLGHKLAYKALTDILPENQTVERLEFANVFRAENEDWEKEMTVALCTQVIRATTSSVKELYFPSLHVYSQDLTRQLFLSLETNKGLETLDLQNCRYIHTWGIAHKVTNRISAGLVPPDGIRLEPLITALTNPSNGYTLKHLDLSGLILSSESVVALADVMPRLGLETVLLRDTTLDASALSAIVRATRDDASLKKLDISHNSIRDVCVMEELCTSLKSNTCLETLKMEHCDIRLCFAEILAGALPDFKGLRNLHMDGNDFTWSPRHVVTNEQGKYVGVFPVGPAMVVGALKHNQSLFHVSVGDNSHGPALRVGICCCTPPPYAPWVDAPTSFQLSQYERRNKAVYDSLRTTKMQEAVIRLAGMLLVKAQSAGPH